MLMSTATWPSSLSYSYMIHIYVLGRTWHNRHKNLLEWNETYHSSRKKKKPTCNWNVERMTKKALFLKYIPQFNSSNYLKLIRGSFYLNQVSDLFCGDDLTKLNFSGIRFETNKRAKILSRELSQTLYYITSEIQNSRHGF